MLVAWHQRARLEHVERTHVLEEVTRRATQCAGDQVGTVSSTLNARSIDDEGKAFAELAVAARRGDEVST
jgi:hypothetical protein